jgi:hypothetical protein
MLVDKRRKMTLCAVVARGCPFIEKKISINSYNLSINFDKFR